MLKDGGMLLAMCLGASVSLDAARTETPRHVAISVDSDAGRAQATATLPSAWQRGDPVAVLIARSGEPQRSLDGTIAVLLSFGVGVVDWRPPVCADEPAGPQRVAAQLGAGAGAALEADPLSGGPRLAGEWGTRRTGASDRAFDRLACALDAVLAPRGHDAIEP